MLFFYIVVDSLQGLDSKGTVAQASTEPDREFKILVNGHAYITKKYDSSYYNGSCAWISFWSSEGKWVVLTNPQADIIQLR